MDKNVDLKSQKRKLKPRYNLFQNSAYMIKLAWKQRKGVLMLCLIIATLVVLKNFLGVVVTPVILTAVEDAVPLGQLIRTILLFVGALMLTGTASTYFETRVPYEHAAFRIILTAHVTRRIEMMSYPHTENQDVLNKIDRVNMTVINANSSTQVIWITLTNLLQNSAGFVVYLFLLASLELWVIGIILTTSIAGFFMNKRIDGWGYRHRDEEASYSRRMNYISNKAGEIAVVKDISMFGIGNWLEDMYKNTLRLFQSFIARRERAYICGDIINVVLTFARNGVAYIYLIGLVLNDGLSAPQFLLYFAAIGGFAVWVNGIFTSVTGLRRASFEIDTLLELLEYPETFAFEDGEPLEPDTGKAYKIELRNVSFRYPGAEHDTLKNINLTIKPGEKLAVVGLNGAGKTTLIKLICGFYDPTEGEVLLDGENIKKYNRRDYYRHFAVVFQEFLLLSVTIAENIAQSGPVDMEKMRDCVEKAGLTAKIESLPQKYDTHLVKEVHEDAIELSGGETQRLMLARALYKDAPILVLDEPTAALDPIAESDMYNKYHDMTRSRTSVYISHRLASTRFCDRIILVENGTILEEGDHSTLVRQGGKYAELFEIQSHYYK